MGSPYLLSSITRWAPILVPAKSALTTCLAAAVVMAGAIGGGVVGVQVHKDDDTVPVEPAIVVKVPEVDLKVMMPLL